MWRWLVAVVDRKRGALVFVGKFIVAMTALWFVAMSGPYAWVRSELTRANAEICGWLLGATGLELELRDGTVLSTTFALTVIPGCSGLAPRRTIFISRPATMPIRIARKA